VVPLAAIETRILFYTTRVRPLYLAAVDGERCSSAILSSTARYRPYLYMLSRTAALDSVRRAGAGDCDVVCDHAGFTGT